MLARRILVTGATRGLGRAIACLLDALGHHTLLVGRDEEALLELHESLNHAKTFTADLGEVPAEHVVAVAQAQLGGLDGLINNAGTIDPIASMVEADPAAWAKAIALNLTTPALLMRAALPQLIANSGRLVNISTGAALKPMPGWGAYCASKAGLLHLTSVVAAETPAVPCFSLRPGVIDTAMQQTIRQAGGGMREADHQRFLQLHSEGALEPPEVPARAAVWLVLEGPLERSGELIDYTDERVVAGSRELFSSLD